MSENPYESPATPGAPPPTEQLTRLLAIAKAQRLVCLVILVAIIFVFVAGGLRQAGEVGVIFSLVIQLGVSIAQVVAVYRLGRAVYDSVAVGCLLMFLALFPCIGLISLLIVNGKATGILQQNGYKVGLMGARLSDFEQRS